jgi:hypothetical protein
MCLSICSRPSSGSRASLSIQGDLDDCRPARPRPSLVDSYRSPDHAGTAVSSFSDSRSRSSGAPAGPREDYVSRTTMPLVAVLISPPPESVTNGHRHALHTRAGSGRCACSGSAPPAGLPIVWAPWSARRSTNGRSDRRPGRRPRSTQRPSRSAGYRGQGLRLRGAGPLARRAWRTTPATRTTATAHRRTSTCSIRYGSSSNRSTAR